ncbi:MAG: TetR/AcrR family transcriptional regulator [Pseudomonadota bacterium]
MKQKEEVQRRRYSPEVRRAMILDAAAEIIAREGVAQVSLERIGQNAGVSKSLMYNYFDSLTELLKELLDRELKDLQRAQYKAAQSAGTFEELVRNITHAHLSYIDERGLIIERLQSEPSVTGIHDFTHYGRGVAVDYLANIVHQNFNIPLDVAKAATDVSFGLPNAAGQYLLRREMDRQALEDLTVTMIIGSVVAIRDEYQTRRQKLKR